MARGRPIGSDIRNHMIDILFHLKKAYGYEIYHHYIEIFPKVTLRVIYYHLKKGTALEEFILEKVETIQGNYSWGPSAEKLFYTLGSNAEVTRNKDVEDYFKKLDNDKENNNN